MSQDFDLIIHGGPAITMSKDREVIENALIGIRNGRLALVSNDEGHERLSCRKRINASGCLMMPGLINTHTHLPMICFRGLADDLPLMDWLNNYIFPVESKFVDRDMVYFGSLLAIAEMIGSGTTTFCDGYFYESSVGRAAVDSGMRAVASQGFIDFPTADNPDPTKNVDIAERFIEKWVGVSPLLTPALVCHSAYTCSPDTLVSIKNVARSYDIPYEIHLAETREEVKTISERYGKTPVRHLYDLGVLDSRTVPAHCVWVDGEEIQMLADTGSKISHNPESNMKLASGIAPIPAMIDRGITVGLGTDGCASNNDLDMFGEMNTTAKLHKVATLNPTVMDAETVLSMATSEGAKVLGLENSTGSLEEGKCADIILLDMGKPHLTPCYNYYSHLVYAAKKSDVKTVIIDGRIVMENGSHLTINIEQVASKVNEIARKVKRNQDAHL